MLSNRESVETKLQRIAEKARKEQNCQFTSLFHLMDKELLRGCFEGLRKNAASGIDRVTKEEYEKDLEANLTRLVERLHRMSYIPQPVRRGCTFQSLEARSRGRWGFLHWKISWCNRGSFGYWRRSMRGIS